MKADIYIFSGIDKSVAKLVQEFVPGTEQYISKNMFNKRKQVFCLFDPKYSQFISFCERRGVNPIIAYLARNKITNIAVPEAVCITEPVLEKIARLYSLTEDHKSMLLRLVNVLDLEQLVPEEYRKLPSYFLVARKYKDRQYNLRIYYGGHMIKYAHYEDIGTVYIIPIHIFYIDISLPQIVLVRVLEDFFEECGKIAKQYNVSLITAINKMKKSIGATDNGFTYLYVLAEKYFAFKKILPKLNQIYIDREIYERIEKYLKLHFDSKQIQDKLEQLQVIE